MKAKRIGIIIGIIIGIGLVGSFFEEQAITTVDKSITKTETETEKAKEEPKKEIILDESKIVKTVDENGKVVKSSTEKSKKGAKISKAILCSEVERTLNREMGEVIEKIKVYEQEGMIVIDITPFDGFILGAKTLGGSNADYKSMISGFKDINNSAKDVFVAGGHSINVTVMVRNDQNKANTVLGFLNGVLIFDYING
ncbi:MAG: hypothetical protein ACRC28_15625 [Clostridium sp.]|uniref:hypothetical protein n=1 Tax=Clostridium sp. TaxID=1506 RepID=UPI003F30CAE0